MLGFEDLEVEVVVADLVSSEILGLCRFNYKQANEQYDYGAKGDWKNASECGHVVECRADNEGGVPVCQPLAQFEGVENASPTFLQQNCIQATNPQKWNGFYSARRLDLNQLEDSAGATKK